MRGHRGLGQAELTDLAVASVVFARVLSSWLRSAAAPWALPRLLRNRGRSALVVATGGHFASAAAAARLGASPSGRTRVFPVALHAHSAMPCPLSRIRKAASARHRAAADSARKKFNDGIGPYWCIGPILVRRWPATVPLGRSTRSS